jgi:hypothetical protein
VARYYLSGIKLDVTDETSQALSATLTLIGGSILMFISNLSFGVQKGRGLPYQFKSIEVSLNLAQSKDEDDHRIKVKLLFSRGINEEKQSKIWGY